MIVISLFHYYYDAIRYIYSHITKMHTILTTLTTQKINPKQYLNRYTYLQSANRTTHKVETELLSIHLLKK